MRLWMTKFQPALPGNPSSHLSTSILRPQGHLSPFAFGCHGALLLSAIGERNGIKQMAETLYLIDGSGFIFRAYYGIRAPMSATDGTPTNAVYGYIRLLMNVLKDRAPGPVAVVFDPPGPTFRAEIYEEYKANRSEPPDDLKPQFGLCRDATTALGIPALELAGYEADDVIGTMAQRWTTTTGNKCIIVTADKDLMQLVNDHTQLWDGKDKHTDHDGVIEKFGVPPTAVADVLGLAGDSSDNIPGVPGIGLKTAATLLQQYGDLDTLLERADEVKGKRGENLRNFKEQALLSRKLATIEVAVPIDAAPEELQVTEPDNDELASFFRRLNFKRFIDEFNLGGKAVATELVDRDSYLCVQSEGQLKTVIEKIEAAGRLSIDLETTGLDTLSAEIVGFALAWAPGEAAYVPVGHRCEEPVEQLSLDHVVEALRPLLESPLLPKIAQNIKYELQVLQRTSDISLAGSHCDTMLAAYLLDPGRRQLGLNELALDLLGHKMISYAEATDGLDKNATFADVPIAMATRYAAEDADVTLRLADKLMPELERAGLTELLHDLELPLAQVLARMEHYGIALAPGILESQSAQCAERLEALTSEIHELAEGPFNIDSPKQLARILFDELELPSQKKTKTGQSTDQSVLQSLATLHPLPARVLDYRHLAKLKNTYLDTLPSLVREDTGRIHSSFRQAVTATGRLSSSDPNLQNIPIKTAEGRAVREAFIARPGWKLLSADYSQIELRLLAHYSNDPGLIGSFADGADIHTRTAAQVFGVPEADVSEDQRRQAKSVNFGLMYGMSAFRLSNELKIPQRDARKIIKTYFEQYSGVKAYFEQAVADARETQQARTLLGRIRPLPHINTRSFSLRQQSERLAINTPIQGTAADILKVAMVNLDAALRRDKLKAQMLLTVHDELVLEVHTDELQAVEALVKSEMEGALSLRVPLVVQIGVGDTWAEIH